MIPETRTRPQEAIEALTLIRPLPFRAVSRSVAGA